VRRWQRYWFAEGGRVSCAILRIAIAVALILTLHRLRHTWPAGAAGSPGPHPVYRPVGIWMLAGHHEPPTWLIDALWALAWTGAVGMLAGAFARVSQALAFVAGVALAALSYSATKSWSHQYNVVFVALLAFQGARSGDALSVDAYVRRLRGLPPIDLARAYQWSIRLVQVAVAVMFASGMFHKVLHGHLTLRWAFSDNLRHHLLVRYDLAGVPRPAIVDWIINDETRYHLAALMNLISQTLPVAAIFLVRRPLLRAGAGLFFVIETIALGVVMQLWNLHWLPLAAVFVDWEALLRIRHLPPVPEDWRAPRGPTIFVIAFIVYDVVLAFSPGIDQKLNTYPVSAFPMFAQVRAREPFDTHQPYSVPGVHFEIEPAAPGASEWLDYDYRTVLQVKDPAELGRRLTAILARVRTRYPQTKLVRVYLTIFETPAYPAPAHFEPHPIAIMGEYDGTFRTHLARRLPAGPMTFYANDIPEPRTGTPPNKGPLYVVETIDGRPWLVYQRTQ
jgi:hypothetical protein